MALVKLNPVVPHFSGSAADLTQLGAGDGPQPGSTFTDVATGVVSVFRDGAWRTAERPVSAEADALAAVCSELRRIRLGLQLFLDEDLPDPGPDAD